MLYKLDPPTGRQLLASTTASTVSPCTPHPQSGVCLAAHAASRFFFVVLKPHPGSGGRMEKGTPGCRKDEYTSCPLYVAQYPSDDAICYPSNRIRYSPPTASPQSARVLLSALYRRFAVCQFAICRCAVLPFYLSSSANMCYFSVTVGCSAYRPSAASTPML